MSGENNKMGFNKDSRDEIKSLDVRSQCRDKISIWYGSRDNYYHGFRELIANANDEITNNFDNGEIHVVLSDDGKQLSVFDSGRGIPITGKTDGKPNYELLFETLFSGTNYDNSENGKITTGTNGSGVCILNNTSLLFDVKVYNMNKLHSITYLNGGYRDKVELNKKNDTDIEHGTKITIILDPEVYTNTIFEENEIDNILNSLAGQNSKIKITFQHKDNFKEYHYVDIKEYLDSKSTNMISKNYSFDKKEYITPMQNSENNELNIIECAWNVSTEPFQETSLNYTALIENGTIYNGFIEGMRKVFNKDNKVKFTFADIEMSFGFVCTVLNTSAEYSNQTKFSTSKQLYKKIVSDYIVENMEIFKKENPKDYDKILEHIKDINKFNTRNENSIKNIKKKLGEKGDNNIFSKIPNLIDCKSKDRNENILCISEGQSSLGAILSGRRDIHAIYPLRGKILNCMKASEDRIFQSDVVVGLIQALGCGVTIKSKNKEIMKFDETKLRYSKIYIMVDLDFDGVGSILPLLLTVFYKLTPELINQGRIYLCETPKYEIVCDDGTELYAVNDTELKIVTSKINGKYTLHYIKGLAEMSDSSMAMCLAEGYQGVKQLKMGDVEKSIEKLELWMGNEIEPRKKYIMNNFDKESLNYE